MKRVLVWAIFGCAVGCGKPDAAPPPPVQKGDVELLTPGTEPRQPVRYHLVKGATTASEFGVDMDMSDGQRDIKMPTFVLSVLIHVDDVLPDGRAKLRFTYTESKAVDRPGASVPASVVAEQAGLLGGIAMTGTLSATGKFSDIAMVPSPKLTAALGDQLKELTESVQQVAMPLPEQPVGAGASWRTNKPVVQNGMKLTMTSTVTMTSLDGDALAFTSKTGIEGADQSVTQGDTTMQISGIGGGGDGKGTIDLAKLAFAGQLAAEFKATMRAMGETAPMNVKMVMRVAPQGAHSAP